MTERKFLTAGEIAGIMGLQSAESFLARRCKLEPLGFPKPVSWCQRPMRWRATAVHEWIEASEALEAARGNEGFDAENVVMMMKAQVA